jgi:hypothetical protein
MHAEEIIPIVADFFILLSLTPGIKASPMYVSKYFLFSIAFVGLNLFQTGFTKIYPLNNIFAKKLA